MLNRRQGVIYFSAVLLASVLITGLLRFLFRGVPPDFGDVYLIAVLLLAYRFSWKAAAAAAGVSLALSAYFLLPLDDARGFQLASFAACAAVIVYVTASIQRRRA